MQALNTLGMAYEQLRRHREALGSLGEAVRLVKSDERLGLSMMDSLQMGMGDAYAGTGQSELAAQSYRDALASAKQVLGPNSKSAVIISTMSGSFLADAGKRDEALQMYQSAIVVIRGYPLQADSDAHLLQSVTVSAPDYAAWGRLTEGMALLDEARAAAIRQPENPEFTALMHVSKARVLVEWGRYDEGRRELDNARRILDGLKIQRGPSPEQEAEVRVTLEARAGHFEAAEAARVRWQLASGKAASPPPKDEHGQRLTCRVRLAQRDLPEARRWCEMALASSRGLPNRAKAARPEAATQLALGTALLLSGDPGAAVPVLRGSLAQMQRILDPERSPAVVSARTALAEALLATGDAPGARSELEAAKAIVGRQEVHLADFYLEPVRRLERELPARPPGKRAAS